jgi:hypothetical protein
MATTPNDSEKKYFPQRKVNGGSAHDWDKYLKKDMLSNLFSGKQGKKNAFSPAHSRYSNKRTAFFSRFKNIDDMPQNIVSKSLLASSPF